MNDYMNKIDLITRDIYTNGRYGYKKVVDANARYYKESIKNPSVARMVYRHTFLDCDKTCRELVRSGQESLKDFTMRTAFATKNAQAAVNYEPAKSAYKAFEAEVEKLYPNSWWIRQFTVDTDRIIPDSVSGKSGFFHKLKVGAYMKKYGITSFFKK